jgi:hypothetical protein
LPSRPSSWCIQIATLTQRWPESLTSSRRPKSDR